MSDLTITNAGISVAKKTGGEVLSNNKKLNQMNVDIIDVAITLDTNANALGEVMFLPAKIENALSVKGGSAILQSVTAIIQNQSTEGIADGTDTGTIDLFITSDATSTNFATVDNLISTGTQATAVANNICGQFSITNFTDIGRQAVGSKQNIGLVMKGESNSRDMYVFGVAQSTNDYNGGTIVLRFGVIQD